MPHAAPAGGHHLLVDLWVEDVEPLRWVAWWERVLPGACRAAGATVLGARFHQFEPEGVTGIVLLSESHASVHTWPEAGLVTLDVFTCGALDAAAIVGAVRQRLAVGRERATAVARGDVQPAAGPIRTGSSLPDESPLPTGEPGEGALAPPDPLAGRFRQPEAAQQGGGPQPSPSPSPGPSRLGGETKRDVATIGRPRGGTEPAPTS